MRVVLRDMSNPLLHELASAQKAVKSATMEMMHSQGIARKVDGKYVQRECSAFALREMNKANEQLESVHEKIKKRAKEVCGHSDALVFYKPGELTADVCFWGDDVDETIFCTYDLISDSLIAES